MLESGAYPGLATKRSIGAVILTLLSVLVLGVATTIGATAFSLAATTALINGASGLPKPADKPGYIFGVADHLLAPNTSCNAITNPACNLVPVNGPETIWPFIGGLGGLTFDRSVAEGLKNLNLEYQAVRAADPDGNIVIFGYSQSGDIVTKQLRAIAADPNRPPTDQLEFLIVGNTNRPNGGLLSRLTPLYIPIFNASFDGPTPTDTGYTGTDIAFHYDGIGDFPLYPLNLLATVNALFGFLTIHPTYPAPNPALGEYTQAEYQAAMADPKNRQTFGDTTFITLPIKNLPILHIPRALAARTGTTYFVEPLLDLIEPTLTVLIELGYDRSIPYGQFTTAGLFPIINPVKLVADLVAAAAQGVEEAIQDLKSPVQPTAELMQANPFPFLNLNPFSAPYVNLPPAAPSTASATAASSSSAAVTEAAAAADSAPVQTTDVTVTDEATATDSTPTKRLRGQPNDVTATLDRADADADAQSTATASDPAPSPSSGSSNDSAGPSKKAESAKRAAASK
ncbi:MAG: PE-PPE domain-containing protein, partial [Mycobacterium sp.]